MKKFLPILLVLLVIKTSYSQQVTQMLVNGFDSKQTISRHIYGHFSEHLGRCIYDGFWVSDTSTLPRKDRIRLDVRPSGKYAFQTCAGREVALLMNTIGGMESVRATSGRQ